MSKVHSGHVLKPRHKNFDGHSNVLWKVSFFFSNEDFFSVENLTDKRFVGNKLYDESENWGSFYKTWRLVNTFRTNFATLSKLS